MTPIVVEAGKHHREQAPRGGIVDRSRTQGNCPHRRAGELFEVDDPRQHRERRDAHGRAKEKHCFHQRCLLWKQFRVIKKNPGQPGTQNKRGDHAGNRHGNRTLELLLDDIDAELHPDDEHVESEPQLRRGEKITLRVAGRLRFVPREDPVLRFRPKQAKERGPEQHPCKHFRNDLRLAETGGDGPDQSAKEKDHRDLQKKLNGEM